MPKSRVYPKFVNDKSDLIGHVAYSLYQHNKWEFIDNFIGTNGVKPSDNDIDVFRIAHCTKVQVEMYRSEAEAVLIGMLKGMYEQEISEHKEALKEEYIEGIKQALKPLQTPWWKNILFGFIGSLFFSVIVLILHAISIISKGGDLFSIFK